MSYKNTYSNVLEHLEREYHACDSGARKINMIKELRDIFGIGLKDAKDLAEWYIGYRYNNCYPSAYNANVVNYIHQLTNGDIRISQEATLGDILKEAVKSNKKFVVIATKDGIAHTNEVDTKVEAVALVAWAKKLGWTAKTYQEI